MKRAEFIKAAAVSVLGMTAASSFADERQSVSATSRGGALSIAPGAPRGVEGALLLKPGATPTFTAKVNDPYAGNTDYEPSSKPSIHWTCDYGYFSPTRGEQAVWTPPRASSVATLRCEYEAEYTAKTTADEFSNRREDSPRLLSVNHLPTRVRLSDEIRVITASPSRFLQDGYIDGFNIGVYPSANDPRYSKAGSYLRSHPKAYAIPDGFYKVTEGNRDLYISENFRIGDFVHDFPWGSLGMPQYIALDYGLVEKLEDLLAMLRRDGLAKKGFTFIYGFRPPSYNLGSRQKDPEGTLKAPFSMHQYGKAVDIIIDRDGDLVLDDLTGDGRGDLADAQALMRYVNELDKRYRAEGDPRVGGAGAYSHNDFRGRKQSPYVHVDTRGFTGANGNLIRWTIR